MLTKIYQLLYTFSFSVECLSGLAFKPQNKSCGDFCRIGDANVSNLILIIRPTALCNRTSAFNMVVHWQELGEVENKCTSYNFRLFAIIVPKIQIWWKFDVFIQK